MVRDGAEEPLFEKGRARIPVEFGSSYAYVQQGVMHNQHTVFILSSLSLTSSFNLTTDREHYV